MLFAGFKTEAGTFYADAGHYPGGLDSLPGLVTGGSYVKKLEYDGDSANPSIYCVLDGFTEGEDQLGWKYLTPENEPDYWECKTSANGGITTLNAKYLPKGCRE